MNRYLCDPVKNTECTKTSCQTLCITTLKPEYKAEGKLADLFDLLADIADMIPNYGERMREYDELFDKVMDLFKKEGNV